MRARRWCAAAVGSAALVLLSAGAAAAHPLGNFSVNRYDGLVVAPGALRIDHVQDLAEIPTVQLKSEIDADGDGAMDPPELARWAVGACQKAAGEMRVTVGGGSAASSAGVAVDGSAASGPPGAAAPAAEAITVGAATAALRPGQAGLPTLRLECSLSAPLPSGVTDVRFAEHDFTGGPGWREVTARGDRMTLTASDVPAASASQRLTAYPKDLLSSPLTQDSATLRVHLGGPALATDPAAPATRVLPRGVDSLTRWLSGLVAHRSLTPGFAALAIGASLLLGAIHALAPGHGKTIMAAAAAGSDRRSLRDVLALGTSVAVTHTAGVAVLGALVAGGSAFAPNVFGWLTAASGALVVGAGLTLFRQSVRRLRGLDHHHHDHHGHTHGHSHDHPHAHDHHHPHRPARRGPILLGFAGGLVPSPSAVLILVAAAVLGRLWFGVLLVAAYGLGLAACLAGVGLLVVRAGDRLRRHAPRHRVLRQLAAILPAGTATAVVVLGVLLAARGLVAV